MVQARIFVREPMVGVEGARERAGKQSIRLLLSLADIVRACSDENP